MYRNLTVIRLSIVSCTYAVFVLQWAAPDLPDDDMSSLTCGAIKTYFPHHCQLQYIVGWAVGLAASI